jgi:hypothetical protein
MSSILVLYPTTTLHDGTDIENLPIGSFATHEICCVYSLIISLEDLQVNIVGTAEGEGGGVCSI